MMNPYEQLKADITSCRKCRLRFDHEPQPIFFGSSHPAVMQISQAPSRKVQKSGLPFSDQSGKTLREWYQITEAAFYDPNHFYMTSVGYCYPGCQSHGDKAPIIECADRFLQRELKIIEPQIYIIIGSYAARFLFGSETALEDLIFQDQILCGKCAYVLPHPSPRNRRWLHEHPQFLQKRMPIIAEHLHRLLKEHE